MRRKSKNKKSGVTRGKTEINYLFCFCFSCVSLRTSALSAVKKFFSRDRHHSQVFES